jgi:DNA (cytosine-5)-methyltransferase 1
MRNSRGDIDALPAAAALLSTPTAGLGTGGGQRSHRFDADSTSGRTHNPKELAADITDGRIIGFGPYAGAVQRWEAVLGRPAPPPAVPNRDGKPRLNPVFVEWMMGFPDGFVTGTGISRTSQLNALGNGCVPQQVMLALDLLVH